MRVLVTGAGGLTGEEACRRLAARGAEVVGVVRRETEAANGPPLLEVGDCADPAFMHRALVGCDALLHVAGIHLGPALSRAPGLDRPSVVVVVSSASIGSPHRASAAVYRAGEEALRAVRPDAVFVRPTMIYGSRRDRNVHRVIEFVDRYAFLPLFGESDGLLQPIHYADLAEALARLVEAPAAGTVEAGGSGPLTLRRAAEEIFAALDRAPRFVRLPLGPAILAATAVDAITGSRVAERLQRMREDRTVDNTRLVELTGLMPRDFRTGVREQVAEMREVLRS